MTSPPLQKVLLREPSSLFRILPSYAVVGRVVLAFWGLFHLSPARGRRSDPATEDRAGAVVISSLFLLSPARGREPASATEDQRESCVRSLWLFLFPPMLSLFHLMLSRVRPAPLSVEQVVHQLPNLAFGRHKSSQRRRAETGQTFFSYSKQTVIGFA